MDPRAIAGIALMVFSGWLVIEGTFALSALELLLAAGLAFLGWRLRRRGKVVLANTAPMAPASLMKCWTRFGAVSIPILLSAYLFGYFVLMDRTRPTNPSAEYGNFESSLRWVRTEPGRFGEPTPYPCVTTFNIIYRPLDAIYFRLFPRSEAEIERLRGIGYHW